MLEVGIYPIPQEIKTLEGEFSLKEKTTVAVGDSFNPDSVNSAMFLIDGIIERKGFAPELKALSRISQDDPFIFVGSIEDLKDIERRFPISTNELVSRNEGYVMKILDKGVVILGADAHGTFYGVQSLLQLMDASGSKIPGLLVRDWPYKPIRGFHLYLPSRDKIGFLIRFIKYFLAAYKFNTLFLEVGAGMRFDKHPEVNAAWMRLCQDVVARGERPKGPENRFQDSVHHELAGGKFLEKKEVKMIVDMARKHYIEVVPEIQSLTHSYYLVAGHREIAELPEAVWPDAYCPSNPKSYELLFEIMDEYIEVMKPKMVHIGHDEWRAAGLCPKCRGKSAADLFAEDVIKIYRYLNGKRIKVAMWADHLIKRHNGIGKHIVSKNLLIDTPTTWQAAMKIPKDILMINWGSAKAPENDEELASYGFNQIYGNYSSIDFVDWQKRSSRPGVLGGEVSSWVEVSEKTFWKDGIIYNAFMSINDFWSTHYPKKEVKDEFFLKISRMLRSRLSGEIYPSLIENKIFFSVSLDECVNSPIRDKMLGYDLSSLRKDGVMNKIKNAPIPFNIVSSEDNAVIVIDREENERNHVITIPINRRANSLVFLHASTTAGMKIHTHYAPFRCPNLSAECLGIYEIVYEDGYKEMVPIKYGENIAEWNKTIFCGFADPILRYEKEGASLYAYEWINPCYDRKISHINMLGVKGSSKARPILIAITGVDLLNYKKYFEEGLGRKRL